MALPFGYDAGFLGTLLPLPLPSSAGETTTLTYPHFSVLMLHERRLAVVTGVNIDGADLVAIPRTGSWHLDPRLPVRLQAGAEIYRRNSLDRGHLVRRSDPGWGADAMAATEATFAYTNAAPQADAFNQSPELWLGLEDHVLEYAGAQRSRISAFTAPVLGEDDPPYRGIRIPRRFWKIAAWEGDDGMLSAAGFLLDQSELIVDLGGQARAVPLPPFRTFQVPIADLAALTGVDFGALPRADVLAVDGARSARWIALNIPEDIVLA